MPAYLVQLPASSGRTYPDGANAVVLFAEDATDAKALAAAKFKGDGSWSGATVTEIAVGTELEGWRFGIRVRTPAGAVLESVEVVGTDADVIDDIGALLETALNATASIANAAYTAGTNTLVIAAGAGGDDLGDHTVEAWCYPPEGGDYDAPDVNIPAILGTITDEGLATANLSIVFNAVAIPAFYASVKVV